MDVREVYSFVDGDLKAVRETIIRGLESDVNLLNTINDAVFSASGKFFRPTICVLAARALGSLNADTTSFAAAAEMIHNATLLHDDVADDSPLRRGRPTIYSLFGAGPSVLMGDFWLVRAMEKILDATRSTSEVMRLFSSTLSALCEGELLQMQKSESLDTTFEDYLRIIYCKTASLFEAAAVSGAMSVDAERSEIEAVREYARYLGYAFQMKDDIFDYTPGSNVGKEVGVDIKEHKITLPLLCALKNVPSERAAVVVDQIKNNRYDEVFAFVALENGVEKAKVVLEEYVEKAKKALAALPEGYARECLEFLADYTALREK